MHSSFARRIASAVAIAAIGTGVALSSTACGAGQISQTADQAAAVNGASVNFGHLALRDVQILYPTSKADEVFGNGGPFKIAFTVSNTSPDRYYRLDSITAPKGTIEIDKSDVKSMIIGPGGALRAGTPVGLLTAEPDAQTSDKDQKRLVVTLRNAGDTVATGLTTKLKFKFSTASVTDANNFVAVTGDTVVDTPVDAGTYMTRQDVPREAEAPESGH